MQYKDIQAFTGVNKGVHPRALPDDKLYDARNVYFKNGKTITRFGYDRLGTNLPLSGSVLALKEFSKLRTDDSDLIAITENSTYEYNETSGLWEEFSPIYNTGTIESGALYPYTFNDADTDYISIALIDSTHIIIAFRDVGDSNKGKCVIGTIDGSSVVTFGSEYTFNDADTEKFYTSMIDSTHIIIAFRDFGDSNKGKCVIGTIDGSYAVTFGSEYTFNDANTYYISIALIDSTHIAIAFRDVGDSNKGKCVIGTIDGSYAVTFGSEYTFNDADIYYISIALIDSTHIIIAFRDVGDSNKGKCIIGTIDGSYAVTFGSEYTFNDADTEKFYTSMIDSTHIIIAFRDFGDSNKGKCVIGTIDGSYAVTFGSEYTFNDASTYYISIALIDSTHIIIAFRDVGDSNKGKCVIGTIDGSYAVTFGSEYTFNDANTDYTSEIALIDSTHIIIAFRDFGDSNKGKVISGYINGSYVVSFLTTITGTDTVWSDTWPHSIYDIKFATDAIDGTGTPDIWFLIIDTLSATSLLIFPEGNTFAASTVYVIRQSFLSSNIDYFDTCNIIEGLGGGDEKQVVFTNGVDPPKLFDGTTLSTLSLSGDGTAPITLAKYCTYYHDILIFAYCYDSPNWLPQSVYWSYRGEPTYWTTGTASYADLTQGDDVITGMIVFNQRLYIWKERSIVECYYTGQVDPALEFTQDKVNGIGQPYGRTIINIGNQIIFKGEDNIYSFTGYQPVPIGNEIIDYIKTNELSAYKYKAFAFHLKKEFLYCLGIVTSGTTPNVILVLNYMTGSWTIWLLHDNVTCFGYYGDNIVLGDESGYVYHIDYTDILDYATAITAYIETKDYPLNDFKHLFRLLETSITLSDQATSTVQISYSVDFGTTWSTPVVINQNVTENVYMHIQNHFGTGKQVRFKLENVSGSVFSLEGLVIGFEDIGISIKR